MGIVDGRDCCEYLYIIANFELIRLYIYQVTYVAQVGDCWIKNPMWAHMYNVYAIIKCDTKLSDQLCYGYQKGIKVSWN